MTQINTTLFYVFYGNGGEFIENTINIRVFFYAYYKQRDIKYVYGYDLYYFIFYAIKIQSQIDNDIIIMRKHFTFQHFSQNQTEIKLTITTHKFFAL